MNANLEKLKDMLETQDLILKKMIVTVDALIKELEGKPSGQ